MNEERSFKRGDIVTVEGRQYVATVNWSDALHTGVTFIASGLSDTVDTKLVKLQQARFGRLVKAVKTMTSEELNTRLGELGRTSSKTVTKRGKRKQKKGPLSMMDWKKLIIEYKEGKLDPKVAKAFEEHLDIPDDEKVEQTPIPSRRAVEEVAPSSPVTTLEHFRVCSTCMKATGRYAEKLCKEGFNIGLAETGHDGAKLEELVNGLRVKEIEE